LENARAQDAPKVWDKAPSNVSFRLERGDESAVADAFASAAHVTKLKLRYPRASANTIEPRAAIAWKDAGNATYTLCSSAQAPFQLREVLAGIFHMAEQDLRVRVPDVGGAFGMKSQIYPEEALV